MARTEEQQAAIAARGKIMVSASAGAGKTTVMIARLADIITGGASLDDVLAVTFTKKAAAQMKTKLRAELIKRLADCKGEEAGRLLKELGKLNQADISTIHSFCARLIRTYFYVLDVDAGFDIAADGAETRELMDGAMDALFGRLYAEDNEDLLYALERLRKKRTDDNLRELLLRAYSQVRILPDYAKRLVELTDGTYSEEGFEKVCAAYSSWVAQRCRSFRDILYSFAQNVTPPANAEKYRAQLYGIADALEEVASSGQIFGELPDISRGKKPNGRPETADYDAEYKKLLDKVKKEYAKFSKAVGSEQEERERFFESGRLARAFCSLLLQFDEEYTAIKKEEGKLDYSDLEQLAYNLLKYGDGDIVRQINSNYKYVFVDEYQDVNPIQAAIMDMVAQGDSFCVGDIKQAIYGFRGSKADIFAGKCDDAAVKDSHIVLPDNFRSSRAVIDFVNALFPKLMTSPLSAIDYSKGNAMRGGSLYPDGAEGRAMFWLFDKVKDRKEEAEGVYSVQRSASGGAHTPSGSLAVLALVRRELEVGSTWYDGDKKQFRQVTPGDICVLTRKRDNAAVQAIMRVLANAGYPVVGVAERNICELPEIRRILDILNYLDNSMQDIPLASAMLSPLGGFTEAELAEIKVGAGRLAKGATFRDAVAAYAAKGGRLCDRVAAFARETDRLRALSDYIGAATLIDEVLSGGGFAGALASAESQAAVKRLQAEAVTAGGELSLAAFLRRLRAEDYKVTMPAAQTGDSITVMTMHASKGLEFPVVIVADIAEEYRDRRTDSLRFDEDYGFAPRCYDTQERKYSDTLLRRVVKLRETEDEVANEINLFYVACTRAKYALHVLCSSADYNPVTAPYSRTYSGFFDINAFKPTYLPLGGEDGAEQQGEVVHIDTSRCDEDVYNALMTSFGRQYAFSSGMDLPVKSSASRLMRFDVEDDISPRLFAEEGQGQTGIERGIAYHRFLELCDFGVRDERGISAELRGWVEDGLMTKEQLALLDIGKLADILAMPALRFADGVKLYREREFICRLSSQGYRALEQGKKADFGVGEEDGNGVIVQGAIDLLVLEYDGDKPVRAAIIDYKFSSRGEQYLKARYAPQLRLYRQVVRSIFGLEDDCVRTNILNINAVTDIPVDG